MNKVIEPIGYVKTDFKEKFGLPRQSGRAQNLTGKIYFYKKYGVAEAFRELDGFSHIWIIFGFSKANVEKFSPTVRPPRLGGNKRVGVFASRSPFRPNGLGLSSVKLLSCDLTADGVVLTVGGIDLLDGTPVYDVKPYIPSSDCHNDALGGYAEQFTDYKLKVVYEKDFSPFLESEKLTALTQCPADDPRPCYISDERNSKVNFSGTEVEFCVKDGVVHVSKIKKELSL